jgi:GTP-binding protein Era
MSAERRSGFVALLGWTNVGKSTLLNRMVGEKLAAVADVSQTTRNRIMGVCNLPDRGQIVFIDTPGLHRPRYRMNRAMVEVARQAVKGVDTVVLVIDAARGIGPGDLEAVELLRGSDSTCLAALNKIDLVKRKSDLLPMMQMVVQDWGFAGAVPISALTGEGCDRFMDELFASLPEGRPPFPEDVLTDQPERVLAAEWIREKLLAEVRQELPHATAVVVERWDERDDGLLEIEASIIVERESQKGIVIGSGGELLKRVGSAARLELESFLGRRIYLRLWASVKKDWRNKDHILRRLGLA